MSDFLFVPMNVRALVVRDPPGEDSPGPADLVPVPRKPPGEDPLGFALTDWYTHPTPNLEPFRRPNLAALQQGVHLHWTLPAALTHGIMADDQTTPLQPCIPNRWIILRLWRSKGAASVSTLGWVIESDFVSTTPNPDATPFPFLGAQRIAELDGQLGGYVGRTEALKTWQETHPPYRFDLKSFAWGDPAFAAYYPACKGVLGFHDRIGDVQPGDVQPGDVQPDDLLTYLVAGWHSEHAKDLLAPPFKDKETFEGRLKELGLSYTEPKPPAAPRVMLLHGAVTGLEWKKYPGAQPSKFVAAAIGGSSTEAFATLLARAVDAGKRKGVEDVLCTFHHGHAQHVANTLHLDELLHRQGFNVLPGGKLWVIERDNANAAATPVKPDLDFLTELITKLNRMQQDLDRQEREVESGRWRLFALWAAWAAKQTGPKGPKSKRPGRARIDQEAKALAKAISELEEIRPQVSFHRGILETALVGTGLTLRDSTMAPFLQPKDPFIVLGPAAPGHGLPEPEDSTEESKLVRCRLLSDLITGARRTGNATKSWDAANIWPLPLSAPPDVPEAITRLAREALLFDRNNTDWIADGPEGRALRALLGALQKTVDQSFTIGNDTVSWTGTPPDASAIMRSGQTNPWLPLFLTWQVDWAPEQAVAAPEKALDRWNLCKETVQSDFIPANASQLPGLSDAVPLEGATLISPLSGAPLARNLNEFIGSSNLFEGFRQTRALAQAFGGITDLMLRQALGLFLPPVDPNSSDPAKPTRDAVWQQIGKLPQPFMPTPSGRFLPVRAGALAMRTLSIVDSFGQAWALIKSRNPVDGPLNILASAALPPAPEGYHARFRPRLAQPARLNFNWAPASGAASGPICGWIVPNYMDKSFDVFSAAGQSLGALECALPALGARATATEMTFIWRRSPGSTLEISDPQLQLFIDLVRNFDPAEGRAFLELTDLVARKADNRVPAEDTGLAILFGRPLALMRATINMELHGLAAGHWDFDAPNWTFNTGGIEALRVPVRIGGMKLPADGLVGYWEDNLQNGFVTSWGATRQINSRRIIYDQDLSVICAGGQKWLTLLMDLGARVHATTGLLPRHFIELTPEQARQAGAIQEFYIRVAPVLGARTPGMGPAMPVPSDSFGQWSWATRPALGWHGITPADDRGRFLDDLALSEGWLKLSRTKKSGAPPISR